MQSIAVINQKGGVGKTTTSVNLAAALSRSGERVGLIDLDPQAHATLHLGVDPRVDGDRSRPTTYDLLTGDAPLAETWQKVSDRLSVAPAHIDLAAVEVELAGQVGREMVLRDQFEGLANDFDFVLIDCPPSLGILTINALAAVGDVFLPLQPHFLALHGLSKLMQTVDLVRKRLNDRLRMAGVVLCMYESGTRLATEVTSDVQAYFEQIRRQCPAWRNVRLFDSRIRRNIRLAEAPSYGQSIFDYDASSRGAEDYQALAGEVLAYYAGRDLIISSASAA